MSDTTAALIYKIVVTDDFAAVQASGTTFTGAGIDLQDGFIHLSTQEQVGGTLARFFADRADLSLVAVRTKDLPDGALRFEAASDKRAGDFPHLYGNFDIERDVEWVRPIAFDSATKKHSVDFS